MSLINLRFKQEYRSLKDDVVNDFYIPALREAVLYQRSVGFFSSSALVQIASGLSGLVENEGLMQLVASPNLSEEDYEAIKKGYEIREVVEKSLIRSLQAHVRDYEVERLNLLASLIAQGYLDIKIVYTSDRTRSGIYHEKLGIVSDSEGNALAFSGSGNETEMAMKYNYEAFDVFCSWIEADSERCAKKKRAFEAIWNNKEVGVNVVEFPRVNEAIILKYRKNETTFTRDECVDKSPSTKKEELVEDNNVEVSVAEPKEGVYFPLDIQLYDYQIEAIQNWKKQDFRGIFDMATGAGKTLTALGAVAELYEEIQGEFACIIVCPYQHLVEQWVEEVKKFGITPIIGYSRSNQKNWKDKLKAAVRRQSIGYRTFFCFVTTNATFATDFVQSQIDRCRDMLLVVDEAHNFGAESLSKLLDERFQYRLALSATLDRFRDEEGTAILHSFFGEKCIEYDLERAINDGKLTPYDYHPIIVYLESDELEEYQTISKEMIKNIVFDKDGRSSLNQYGMIQAIKRARLVASARQKIDKLQEVMVAYRNDNYILVYCGATNVSHCDKNDVGEIAQADLRQVDLVTQILGNKLEMKVAQFTANENTEERRSIIECFKTGRDIQALIAIKCLDEGVNIPSVKTAFILASSTNPREYVQRRGRVLRRSPETGKNRAIIYDFITLPRPLSNLVEIDSEQIAVERSLIRNELSRAREFARLAKNSMEATKFIWGVGDRYDVSIDLSGDRYG